MHLIYKFPYNVSFSNNRRKNMAFANMNSLIRQLETVGNAMKELCPLASQYCLLSTHMKKPKRNYTETKNGCKKWNSCQHCGNIFLPNSCRVRLHARPVLKKKMKKLIARQQKQPWALKRSERERISAFKKSHNKIVYQCLKCSMYTEFDGSRIPSIPMAISSIPAVLYCPKTPKRKKKEVNAGLRYSLDNSRTSINSDGSPNLLFPSFAKTPISDNKKKDSPLISNWNSKNTSDSTEQLVETILLEKTKNFKESGARSTLLQEKPNKTSTPKIKNKHRDSLLFQMLKENEEKSRLSSSSLSSFLSSL